MNANPVTPTDNSNGACPTREELGELLNDAIGGDQQSAWEEHLGNCDRCQQVLEELAVAKTEWEVWGERMKADGVSWPDATVYTSDASDPDSWPVVPGYQIKELIGRGGMGVVFRAKHLALDREVALKTIAMTGPNQKVLRNRLQREAEAMASLHHPHIVQIFEILDCDGTMVLALEYIRGGSLADRLRESNLSPPEAARLLELVARTMQDTHDADILHRDLKPANILLTVDGIPKITDFGLARRVEEPGDTKTGQIIGTPSYLAPEQAQGFEGWSTPAVDVYGIGAVLYESLTGRPPFRSSTSFETLRQVIHEEPVSPSRLQQKLPRDIVTICLKCLRKDPTRRYASCGELADDLQRFQSGEPIRARRVSPVVRGLKWVRRRPLVSGLSFAFLATLITLGVVLVKYSLETATLNDELLAESKRVKEQIEIAEKEREKADLSVDQMNIIFSQTLGSLQSGSTLSRHPRTSRLVLVLPLESFARVVSRQNHPKMRLTQALNYNWVGKVALQYGEDRNAVKWLALAVRIRTFLETESHRDPKLSLDLAVYRVDYAEALFRTKKYEQAFEQLQQALEIVRNPQSVSTHRTIQRTEFHAATLFMLAKIKAAQQKSNEARRALQESLKILDSVPTAQRTPEQIRIRANVIRTLNAGKN